MRHFSENFKIISKILLAMYGVSALLLFLLAFLVQKLQWSDEVISTAIIAVYFLSFLAGGFLIGKIKDQNKLFWRLLLGLLYVLSMMVVSFVFSISP